VVGVTVIDFSSSGSFGSSLRQTRVSK